MENMKFNDSCIGFALEAKQCSCLAQFLGKDVMQSDAKMVFIGLSSDLWHDNTVQNEDGKEVTKDKVTNFWKPFHVVRKLKNFFHFEVKKEKSSVTEGMEICLPITCLLLGISRCLGQAIKAALLHKEEAATKVLVTVSETKYPGSRYYQYYSNNLNVPGQPSSTKPGEL